MIWWVLLGAVILLTVVAWTCRGQAWAKPVLVLCVLGAGALVVYRAVGSRHRAVVGNATEFGSRIEEIARLMGTALRGQVGPGARVVVLGNLPPGMMVGQILTYRVFCQKGLSAALQDSTVEILGYAGPATASAADLSAQIESIGHQVDAIVSLYGLPEDAEALSIYTWEQPPKVVGYFPLTPDRARIATWLEKGVLQGAVLLEGGSFKLYTSASPP